MRSLALGLASFFVALSAQAADHYVDNAASGSNDGSSWSNAWKSLEDIDWGSVQPGETIYVSGGADSKTYFEQLTVGKSGTAGSPIAIMAGRYSSSPSGHDGRVVIDGGGTRSQSIYVQNKSYVTLKGFECAHASKGIYVEDNANTIILDSMDIHDYQGQAGIMLNGANSYTVDNVTIRNSKIVSPAMYDGETDTIYIQRAQRTTIHDNYVHQRNQDPKAHTDALQAYLASGFVIYNNYFINDSVFSPEGGGTPIILGSEGTNPVIIYNNYLYMGGVWDPTGNHNSALWTRWYDNDPMPPTWVIHNTIVVAGPRCRNFIQEYDAVTVNNIFAVFNASGSLANLEESLPHAIPVDDIRNNLFWRSSGGPGFSGQFTGKGQTGSVSGWTDWVNTYGGTGVNADPLFVDDFIHTFGDGTDEGALDGELQSGSPAIDKGEDAKPLIDTLNSTYGLNLPWADIYGNPRDSTPTIGAYEYCEGASCAKPDGGPGTGGGAGNGGGVGLDGGAGTSGGAAGLDGGAGTGGTAGTSGAKGSSGSSADDGGCGCRSGRTKRTDGPLGLLMLGGFAALARRRRRTVGR
ncbi:MAG: right-handed parallel beta-helix repeat-containing protein [Polyangiaceae bacterium]